MPNTDNLLAAAGRWFLHSGIQEPSGGVARYYRTDTRRNAPVSTEITGYAISALLFLYARTGHSEYLDAALRSARFLTRTAWDAGLQVFPFEHFANGDHSRPLAYFFDCGIIVRGLLAAWRVSNEPEFLDTAIAAGRAMMRDFRASTTIHPILALPEKQPLTYEPRWSRSPGCYQLKSAMAWHELFEATGDEAFFRAYDSAVDTALASEYGFLPGETDREKIMDRLHAYAYFLEGLLPVLDRARCAQVFNEGIDRAATYLQEIAPVFARSDVYAQLLRVRLHAGAQGIVPVDRAAAAQEAAQLSGYQAVSGDSRIDGGFLFGRKCGEPLPFVNPVSTAFCVQALVLWDDHNNKILDARRPVLI